MHISPEKINNWLTATKTKPLKAKPVVSLVVDRSVVNRFLLTTIEGNEPLVVDALACLGEAGDIWQQSAKKMLSKYNVVGVDAQGWMDCDPKPGNACNCVEITAELLAGDAAQAPAPLQRIQNKSADCYIIGLYGEATSEGLVQYAKIGDFICQDRENPADHWIVARKIFLNTYNTF